MDNETVLRKTIEHGLSERTKWIDEQSKAIKIGDQVQQIICSMNITKIESIIDNAIITSGTTNQELIKWKAIEHKAIMAKAFPKFIDSMRNYA